MSLRSELQRTIDAEYSGIHGTQRGTVRIWDGRHGYRTVRIIELDDRRPQVRNGDALARMEDLEGLKAPPRKPDYRNMGRIIVEYVRDHPGQIIREIAEGMGVVEDTAWRHCKAALEAGTFRREKAESRDGRRSTFRYWVVG